MPDRPSTDLSTPVKFGDVAHELYRPSVDGWQKLRFGELAFHISDRVDDPKTAGVTTYVGLDHLDPGSLKIKRRGTPDDVNATKLRVKPGQIIFGKRRAYQRKVAVADFDGICSAHAMVLEANPKTTAPGFLPFFMQSDIFFDRALAISEGSLSPTIKWKTLATQEFFLPPIARQKELVSLFQAIEDAISATEESISAAEELKRSLLKELFTKGIEHNQFKRSKMGVIPSSWEEIPLNELCLNIIDCPHTTPNFTSNGFLVIRNFNIKNGTLDISEPSYTDEADYLERIKRCVPREGDILFSREAPVGEACLIPPNICLSLGQRTMLIRVNSNKLSNKFLMYSFYSEYIKRKFDDLTAGATVQHLNVKDVRELLIRCPSLPEQFRIGAILTEASQEIYALQSNVSKLQNLKFQTINNLLTNQYSSSIVEIEQEAACT